MKTVIVNKSSLQIACILHSNDTNECAILRNDYPNFLFEFIECSDSVNLKYAKIERDEAERLTILNDENEIRKRAFELLRDERNFRLDKCGWIIEKAFSTGTPLEQKWIDYMQALRDLPATASPHLDKDGNLDLTSITWPSIP